MRISDWSSDVCSSDLGTYTAYSGRDIRSELLRTRDFRDFTLTPIKGGAGRNKGMALFPRKIDGKFCMIGRQDGKNLYLLRSDSIDLWEGGEGSEERRVGKGCVSMCRYRGLACH